MLIATERIIHVIITILTSDIIENNRRPPHKSDFSNTTIGSHIAVQLKYLLFRSKKQSLNRCPAMKAE